MIKWWLFKPSRLSQRYSETTVLWSNTFLSIIWPHKPDTGRETATVRCLWNLEVLWSRRCVVLIMLKLQLIAVPPCKRIHCIYFHGQFGQACMWVLSVIRDFHGEFFSKRPCFSLVHGSVAAPHRKVSMSNGLTSAGRPAAPLKWVWFQRCPLCSPVLRRFHTASEASQTTPH